MKIEIIKEFALGVSNRHNFQSVDKISEWMGTDSDTYMSLYNYDEYVVEFYAKNKSFGHIVFFIFEYDVEIVRATEIAWWAYWA